MIRYFVPILLLCTMPACLFGTGGWAEPPKGLEHYEGRLPAKSIPGLVREGPAFANLDRGPYEESYAKWSVKNLVEGLPKQSREWALGECDRLMSVFRISPEIPNAWLNLLHDFRDCLADEQTPFGDAISYCRWRHDLGILVSSLKSEQIGELNRKLQDSGDRRVAHYRYLLGAHAFIGSTRNAKSGVEEFTRVVDEFSDHPRAETALFMRARALQRNLPGGWEEAPSGEQLDTVEKAYQEYLAKFPEGRFVADTYGWLGGLEVKRNNWSDALRWYLKQLDDPAHPEVVHSGSQMVERVMSIVLAKPDESAIDDIAKRPDVAMGTVYWLLHAPEADRYNGFFDHPEVVKKWRAHWLPKLAASVRANREAWEEHQAMPWFAAIQAYAESNSGNQEQAFSIIDEHAEHIESSDDLAFVLAIVLERAGRSEEAVEAYRSFMTDFRDSPLREGARVRLAGTLCDAGKSGDAVAVLVQAFSREQDKDDPDWSYFGPPNYFNSDPMYPGSFQALPSAASTLSPDISAAEPNQIQQYTDTLLHFAPIEELAALSSMISAFDPEIWESIRLIVLGRAVKEGHPDIAQSFADSEKAVAARELAELVASIKSQPSATGYLQLGNAWRDARGQFTSAAWIADRESIYIAASTDTPESLRLSNARAVGFSDISEEQILEMDELWIAVEAWENAAKLAAPGSGEEAEAIGEILEALPLIAQASPFARKVAHKENWTERARTLHETLLADCPDSPQARKAARPSFPDPNENSNENEQGENPVEADPFAQVAPPWRESIYAYRQSYARHREHLYKSLLSISSQPPGRYNSDPTYDNVAANLFRLRGDGDPGELLLSLRVLRNQSREHYRHWNQACIHYAIEDLAELVSLENPPPPEVVHRYLVIRRHAINVMAWHSPFDLPKVNPNISNNGGPEVDAFVAKEVADALADPAMKSVHDRLECLRIYMLANRQISIPIEEKARGTGDGETTIETRDYAEVEKAATQFLAQYPDSRKREQVWLLRMRAAYRARRPLLYSVSENFPENPFIGSSYIRKYHANLLPWDAAPVEATIAGYLAEFPQPSYPGEIESLRAALATQRRDWKSALEHTLIILTDPKQRDLHAESSQRLCNLFARIADRRDRVEMLNAIRTFPAARGFLREYLDATAEETWNMEPLHYLTDWIGEQI